MSSIAIKQLLKTNRVWQASDKKRARPALSSGFPELDKQLHYSGWPQGALSELLLSCNGIGELRLLAPLMAKLSEQSGYICWINPPFQPYAPALSHLGIQLDKMIIINTRSDQETIWAAQQAMNSKSCATVLTWLPQKNLSKEMRKLSLAAENSQCWGIVLRHQHLHNQSSSAALRIILQPRTSVQGSIVTHANRLNQLSIIKQPGGWSGQKLTLNLFPESIYWNAQPANLWPILTQKATSVNQKTSLLDQHNSLVESSLNNSTPSTHYSFH